MKLDVFDVIALTIHANDNEILSKATIQKLIYFHSVTIKNLDILSHVHYFYGPFSSKVSAALEDMFDFSYIEKNIISRYYEICNYKLTSDGIKYAQTAKKNYPKEFEKITETLNICKKYCDLKPTPLSYAAKAHHILTNSKDRLETFSTKDVNAVTADFDWNISKDDALTGLELLQKLNLVCQ